MHIKALTKLYHRLRKIAEKTRLNLLAPINAFERQLDLLQQRLTKTNRRIFLALLIAVCLLSGFGAIAGSQWMPITLRSGGRIRVDQVGIYRESNCSTSVTYLDWGTLEPGAAQNIAVFIRNEGNYASTLFLTTNKWNQPDAETYLSLNWNYNGTILAPMQSVEVTLTLSVSQEAQNISDFSFDVTIGLNA